MLASLSSHVLDLQHGKPVAQMHVTLHSLDSLSPLAVGVTDADGRIRNWSTEVELAPGNYRLDFETGEWFAAQKQATLYPVVQINFTVSGDQAHYHIPLLLSPYGYSTYRGS